MADMHMKAFILLLITMLGMVCVSGTPPVANSAVICSAQSTRFDGRCTSNLNCNTICRCSGFTSGECRGFFSRNCICLKPCK